MSQQSKYDKSAAPVAGALILWILILLYPATTIGSYVGHVTGDDIAGTFTFLFCAAVLLILRWILEAVQDEEMGPDGTVFCFFLWIIYAGAHVICFVPFIQIVFWGCDGPFPDLHWFWGFTAIGWVFKAPFVMLSDGDIIPGIFTVLVLGGFVIGLPILGIVDLYQYFKNKQ